MMRPWMPLYVGDYLGDTGHLTTTQHGAYLLLIMHYWRKGGLPDDDKQLAKITKLPFKVWVEQRETIQAFFHEGWHHKRINAELSKAVDISGRRAVAGQKGGLRSALSRMKLETGSLSKHASKQAFSQANAEQLLSKAAAKVDHSHSQRITSSEYDAARAAPVENVDKPEEEPNGKSPRVFADKRITASDGLAEVIAKKGWVR
jgi:uncharacterized protein YdaU (DUF1376 family)